ncbi:zinc-ribbon domain-containing protein [Enterococcus asini]|uniref:zinc ribbon domain-containing protein n=1 Tax=Enterococcus asini TaxID=57732 RepID=UPI0028910966|nr:zinc ribbon domain-containing protein [Enterococcus asini]MDT2784811.1 zinc-ribbon domain-containing protein [Enterococcus asini]
MKNCPNCGAALPEDSKACPVCGYVLQQKIPRGDLTKEASTKEESADLAKAGEAPATATTDSVSAEAGEKLAKEVPADLEAATSTVMAEEDTTESTVTEESTTQETEADEVAEVRQGLTAASSGTEDVVKATHETGTSETKVEEEGVSEPTAPELTESPVLEGDRSSSESLPHETEEQGESPEEATKRATTSSETAVKTFTKKPELTVLPGGKQAEEEAEGPTPGDHLLGYFRFLNRQILSPNFNQIGPATKAEKWYGVASFLIIVLSNGFALSRLLTSLIYRVLGMIQSFGLQFQYRGSNLLFFFELSLYLAVAGVIYLLAYYLVAGKIFGRPVQFLQALGELMAPASLAVYLSLGAVVFSLLLSDMSKGILTFVVASLLLVGVSFVGNLWQTPNLTGRFNRFYTILLTSLVCLLVLVLVSRFFLTGMLQDLPIQQVPTGIEDLFGESDLFY